MYGGNYFSGRPFTTRAAHGGLTALACPGGKASHRIGFFAVCWPNKFGPPTLCTLSMEYPSSASPVRNIIILSRFFTLCLTRQLPFPLGPSSRPPHAKLCRCTLTQPLSFATSNLRFSKVTANHLGTTLGPAIDVLDHDRIIQLDLLNTARSPAPAVAQFFVPVVAIVSATLNLRHCTGRCVDPAEVLRLGTGKKSKEPTFRRRKVSVCCFGIVSSYCTRLGGELPGGGESSCDLGCAPHLRDVRGWTVWGAWGTHAARAPCTDDIRDI
jgi:hypothetical protein